MKEAKSARRRIFEQAENGGWRPPTTLTLEQYATRWLERKKPTRVEQDAARVQRQRLSPATFESYELNLRRYVFPRLGGRPLVSIRRDDVDDLIAELEAQGKAPGTVRNIIVPLRSLLNDAVPDHLPSNPAARVNLPPAQDFAGAELSYEETARIRAALEALAPTKANGEPDLIYVHLFDVALGTGLRFGELAALRWRDYDRERTLIRVERAISRRQAKAPKTAAGRRSVPAFPGVVLALRALLVRASETGRWTRDDPIFTTKLGKPLDRSNFGEDVWRPALRKAGLVDGDGKTLYRFHDLRHTCASRLVASGCRDVKLIQTVVGHSNAAILLNRYSHLTDERVTEAATTYDPAVRSAL